MYAKMAVRASMFVASMFRGALLVFCWSAGKSINTHCGLAPLVLKLLTPLLLTVLLLGVHTEEKNACPWSFSRPIPGSAHDSPFLNFFHVRTALDMNSLCSYWRLFCNCHVSLNCHRL